MKNKGKFIIAFDTICDGWQCALDDDGKPHPTLFDSKADAMVVLFGDAIFMLENKTIAELKDDGITTKEFHDMNVMFADGEGDPEHMKNFLDAHPSCNYNDEFIIPAEEFIFGRKAIFGSEGLKITGKKLS